MKKVLVILVLLANLVNLVNAEETVKIGKQNIKLSSNLMTPEALWAMGRIAGAEASADGKQIVYQVGYYSVKANKSQQKIAVINADGTGNTTLTTGSKSETDPTWINGKIAFLSGGQLWTMNPDGSDRKQISKTAKDIACKAENMMYRENSHTLIAVIAEVRLTCCVIDKIFIAEHYALASSCRSRCEEYSCQV